MAPAVDIMDESFVVADAADLARRFADPALWRDWWPELDLTVTRDRGSKGVQWSVAGALVGSAEIWLEPWRDGVIVHWFVRADPVHALPPRRVARLRESYVRGYKRRIHALKDEFERDLAGEARRAELDR